MTSQTQANRSIGRMVRWHCYVRGTDPTEPGACRYHGLGRTRRAAMNTTAEMARKYLYTQEIFPPVHGQTWRNGCGLWGWDR